MSGDQIKEGRCVSNSPMAILNPLGGGATASIRVRKNKYLVDEDVVRIMVDKVGDLSHIIGQIIPEHWTVQLSKCVYDHLNNDDGVLYTTLQRCLNLDGSKLFHPQALESLKEIFR